MERQQSYFRNKIQIPFFSYIVWIKKKPTCATIATSVHRYSELNSHICHRNTQVKYVTSELSKSFTTEGRSRLPILKTFFSLNQEFCCCESDSGWVISTITHRIVIFYTELLPVQIQFSRGSMLPVKFIPSCSQAETRVNQIHTFRRLYQSLIHWI